MLTLMTFIAPYCLHDYSPRAGEVKRGLSAATDAALPAEVDDATRMATKASGSITEAAADNAAASAAATNRAKAD